MNKGFWQAKFVSPMRVRSIGILWMGACVVCLPRLSVGQETQEEKPEVSVESPDGDVLVQLELQDADDQKVVATLSVFYRGTALVEDSRLGLEFSQGGYFGSDLQITKVVTSKHDETYQLAVGKSSTARDHYRQVVVTLDEQPEPHRRIELVLRAYDEGAAFRYRIPEQPALKTFTITQEHSQFSLDSNCQAYALPLAGFVNSYEAYYDVAPLRDLKADALYGLPMLLKHPSGTWFALTEANLTDYAGMYLTPSSSQSEAQEKADRPPQRTLLESRLSPWPGQPEVKVKATAPHDTPWRVLMIGDEPGELIESNLILNLSEPCALADTDWIKPGKTTFPWWNDFVAPDVDFKPDLNTATMKYYIDFCAEHGIEYHSLDGYENRAWYGGLIRPDGPTDITTAVPAIDLPEVLRYAKQKNVGIRLWMHWLALRPQIDEALALYEQWGIEGIMVDFMDRDDQEMVNFYEEMARKTAEHHLTLTLHGSYKPAGLRRTYPNVLTYESVLNREYNKFGNGKGRGCTPAHELLVPFTRMLAGPLDFHHGGFLHVTEAKFKSRSTAPQVMGTRSRTLAMYVVYEDPLPMVADYPAAYRGQTGIEFLAQVPTTWDETRVLNAAVGQAITIARRRGEEWYVGSMTDSSARELEIPLSFLPEGEFLAEIYADDTAAPESPANVICQTLRVTAATTITAKLAPAGGHAIRLTRP